MVDVCIKFKNKLSLKNKLGRLAWGIVCFLFFRPFPTFIFRLWRICVLRVFGAKVSWRADVHASARIWAPWLLIMDDYAQIDDRVNVYNVNYVVLKEGAVISQGAFICPGSHDIRSRNHELISSPITIERMAWVAAGAFIGKGVTVGAGAVVGAMAVVYKDVSPWTVVVGNPAVKIRDRKIER